MEENVFNHNLPCVCYVHTDEFNDCLCSPDECVLRHYAYKGFAEPMTAEQRDWCIREANYFGEGPYSPEELKNYSDRDLATAVLGAWNDYVRSQLGY